MFYFVLGNVYWTFNLHTEFHHFGPLNFLPPGRVDQRMWSPYGVPTWSLSVLYLLIFQPSTAGFFIPRRWTLVVPMGSQLDLFLFDISWFFITLRLDFLYPEVNPRGTPIAQFELFLFYISWIFTPLRLDFYPPVVVPCGPPMLSQFDLFLFYTRFPAVAETLFNPHE